MKTLGLLVGLLLVLLMAAPAWAGVNRLDLSWTPSVVSADGHDAPTGYEVERAAGVCTGATFTKIATVPGASAASYADTGLAPGTYSYRVRAVNAVGASGYTNCATGTATAPPSAPQAPTGLSAQ